MGWFVVLVGAAVIALGLTSWAEVVYVITRGAGGSQSPSAFATWWLEWMRWVVVALGILAITTSATTRRSALALIALTLGVGTLCLVYWQLNPPEGTLTGRPTFGNTAWACVIALTAAALGSAWRAGLASGATMTRTVRRRAR